MKKSKIITELQGLVAIFLADDGQTILEKPKTISGYPKLTERSRVTIVKELLHLLLNTKFSNEIVKVCLKNKRKSYGEVGSELKKTSSYVQTTMYKFGEKIKAVFGSDIVQDLVSYDNDNLADYKKKLAIQMVKYKDTRLLDEIELELPEAEVVTKLKQERFEDFLEYLQPYSKRNKRKIVENMDKQALGYLKYILSSSTPNKEDLERKQQFIECMGISQNI